MKKLAIVLSLFSLALSCSKEEQDKGCECETINFKQTVNRTLGIYTDYNAYECLSAWEEFGENAVNFEIDHTTTPVSIYGPSPEQIELLELSNCE